MVAADDTAVQSLHRGIKTIRKFVAYYRVSTGRQGRSGLGLEAQRTAVHDFLAQNGGDLSGEVIEIESGAANDRPQLAEALRLCRLLGGSLIIAKLDRLARNVAFVSSLMEAGVDFLAVDFPTANRLTVHILAAVAEHERDMISQRTSAALQAAKVRGVKLGGDRGNLPAVAQHGARASATVRAGQADKRAADIAPLLHRWRTQGMSLRQMARSLDDQGITPARGGTWTATQIARTIARVAA